LLVKGIDVACGDVPSLCADALALNYETTMRSDSCALTTLADFNDHLEDYVLWLPKYRRKACEGNGYLNCSADTERFGPKQVKQESFLQGRGQVTSNPGCAAGGITYLPSSEFAAAPAPRQTDMTLFAQPTTLPRSCGTLAEVDIQRRVEPLPGAWQGSFSPLAGMLPLPNDTARKSVTLGTRNKYPDWGELKEQSEPYRR
jgi:hypothetical protein